MGVLEKVLGKLTEEQIKQLIRGQARAEIESYFNPTFLESMRKGFEQFHGFLDTINTYDDRLDIVEREIKALQKIVAG
jgi:hypothetical protein